jgi:hypothetical protein
MAEERTGGGMTPRLESLGYVFGGRGVGEVDE